MVSVLAQDQLVAPSKICNRILIAPPSKTSIQVNPTLNEEPKVPLYFFVVKSRKKKDFDIKPI